MSTLEQDPGSFRDPTSRVYVSADHVYRGLGAQAASELKEIVAGDFFQSAVRAGKVVATRWVDDPPPELAGWKGVLAHERIPFLSYPYEWCFEMLRDAARLQLDLLRTGLDADVTCKDASAFNVQFVGTRPIFIDVGSFERYRSGDPWFGYRQFCQLYLYPLMFQAYKDLPFQPWLRGAIDGITPSEAAAVLGGRKLGRRGMLTHVYLHARLERRYADTDRDIGEEMKRSGFRKELILANLKGLTKLVERMEWKRSTSTWSSYSERSHYTDRDLAAKADFVKRICGSRHRRMVWDLGANDGHFSRIAAEHADRVVAVDSDALVVDRLYRELRSEGQDRILPLVTNLADPAGGLGWRGRERRAFLERGAPDLVLALALVHHLAIGSNVPLDEVLRLFADLGAELVVELPTREDPMVQRLLRQKREGIHDSYGREPFEELLAAMFDVQQTQELPSGTRVLYAAIPR